MPSSVSNQDPTFGKIVLHTQESDVLNLSDVVMFAQSSGVATEALVQLLQLKRVAIRIGRARLK
jgi:hypothetical protein